MPHSSIHGCFDTNWKPPRRLSNPVSNQTLIAPVATDVMPATSLTYSGRRFDSTVMSSAPAAGRKTSTDRIGNANVPPCTSAAGGPSYTTPPHAHHSIPRPTTNQTSSSTTPRPRMAA